MRKLDIILTCTGRTASGFYAQYLTSAGIECGHEQVFTPWGYDAALKKAEKRKHIRAESAWESAPWLDSDMLKDAFVVHLIRHPKNTIESWMRQPTECVAPRYWDYAAEFCPKMDKLDFPIDKYAHRYIAWNRLIESKLEGRDYVRFDVARPPRELLDSLNERGLLPRMPSEGELYKNRNHNKHGRAEVEFHLGLIHDQEVKDELIQISADYGYQWPESPKIVTPVVKAVITTLDNCDLLERQISVLNEEPVDEIVVVNNGSTDGTKEWLDQHIYLTTVHRGNNGAGPGRNAGLDAAGEFDYVLMLDGGVLPAFGTIDKMLTWLGPRKGIGGIGVEIDDLRTDYSAAWLRWTEHISRTYRNLCLSHTGYGLFRRDVFDGRRFCEEGPFSMPGWGGDDNEFAYQLRDASKEIHVVTCGCRLPYFGAKDDGTPGKCIGGSVHAYRRKSGSWARIKRETSLDPWGQGSVYEERVMWLQHNWPQYDLGEQRDEPWFTLVIKAGDTIEETAAMIQLAHEMLYRRKLLEPRHGKLPNPYSLILWLNEASPEIVRWADYRHLRRHYGEVATIGGRVIHLNEQNRSTWTGDFRLSFADDWHDDLRPNAYFYGYAETVQEVESLIMAYNHVFPNSAFGKGPAMRRLKDRPKQRFRGKRIEVG